MNQETLVKPEPYVKVCMALAALSLITIAVCQVILILRPPTQPMMRRPVVPMENWMVPPGMQPGQGMPEGAMQRPPPPAGQGQIQPAKR